MIGIDTAFSIENTEGNIAPLFGPAKSMFEIGLTRRSRGKLFAVSPLGQGGRSKNIMNHYVATLALFFLVCWIFDKWTDHRRNKMIREVTRKAVETIKAVDEARVNSVLHLRLIAAQLRLSKADARLDLLDAEPATDDEIKKSVEKLLEELGLGGK